MKLKFLTFLALLLSVQFAVAQRTITGTVNDADTNEPLIGANVLVAGTSTGTITDFNGDFSLEVADDATTLNISYTGYTDQEVSIAGGISNISVALASGELLDEVVVTGYAVEKKKDLRAKAREMADWLRETLQAPRTSEVE